MRILTDQDFRSATAKGAWIVYFWSPTCAPCGVVKPMLARLEQAHGPDVNFASVDGTTEVETAMTMQVSGYPTVMTLRDGEPIGLFLGAKPFKVYEAAAETLRVHVGAP